MPLPDESRTGTTTSRRLGLVRAPTALAIAGCPVFWQPPARRMIPRETRERDIGWQGLWRTVQ
jgi:hypothetical protein